MTEDPNLTIAANALEPILNYGLEGLPDAVATLINHAMLIEREHHIGAGPYQRTEGRDGHANGFKERRLNTRLGTLQLRVPQVRGSDEAFFPSVLERGQRSEKALTIAIAEMYLQGVSTRRVTKIMEELCGLDVTSNQVSKAAAELDEMLEAWRTRELEAVSHLVIDARYEKVRHSGVVRSCALLVAVGIRTRDGKRSVLGCSVSLSEAEVHWREFLSSLKRRGLELPKSITSDAHEGLKAALAAVFPGGAWQRCQFHLQQNAQAYVPKKIHEGRGGGRHPRDLQRRRPGGGGAEAGQGRREVSQERARAIRLDGRQSTRGLHRIQLARAGAPAPARS